MMTENYSTSVQDNLSSLSLSKVSCSKSLSDLLEAHNDKLFSSGSSSSEEVAHTGAVVRLRKETLGTLINPPDASPLSATFVNIDQESILPKDESVDILNDITELYSEEFKEKETHIFILSKSGKPIFSRYGSDSQIASFIGVMQALVSFVEHNEDKLKVVTAGNHNFVFQIYEHMILVAVSQHSFVPNQLRIVLQYLYHQILSILTFRTISKAFRKHPSLDLRRLLVGTDRYLNGLIDYMETDMGPLLNAVTCVPMQATLRQALLNTISQAIKVNIKLLITDLVFAILLLNEKLVGVVRRKDYQPHPMDLHVVLNLIRNSTYFKNQICWLPLCLPKFDPDGYFHAHISYLDDRLSLVLLSVNPDHFDVLQQSQSIIIQSMRSNGLFEKLNSIYSVEELIRNSKLAEVRHFIYKMRNASQCISYSSSDVFDEKDILSNYLRLHNLIHLQERPARLVYQCTELRTLFAWQTSNFELYVTLNHVIKGQKVMEIINKLLDAINKQKNRLFITISPTF